MRRWYVVTPEYDTVVPVLDFGQGPIERGADVIEIEAETRRDAITLGVKEMLRLSRGHAGFKFDWCRTMQSDGSSPFTGVYAEPVD